MLSTRAGVWCWVAVLLLAFLLAQGARAAEKGDVQEDGVVDAADALAVGQALQGLRSLTPAQQDAADVAPIVNGSVQEDGAVDAADLTVLHRALGGEDLDGDAIAIRTETQAG